MTTSHIEQTTGSSIGSRTSGSEAEQFVRLLLFSKVFSESFDIKEERARVWYLMTTLMAAEPEPDGTLDYGRLMKMPEVHEFVGWSGHVYREWKYTLQSFEDNFNTGGPHIRLNSDSKGYISVEFVSGFYEKVNVYVNKAVERGLICQPSFELSNLVDGDRLHIFRRLFQYQKFVYFPSWAEFMNESSHAIAELLIGRPPSTAQRIDRFSDFNKYASDVRSFMTSKYLIWATILIFASEAIYGRFNGLYETDLVARFRADLFYGKTSDISKTLMDMATRLILEEERHGIQGSTFRIRPELEGPLKKFAASIAFSGKCLSENKLSLLNRLATPS